LIDKIAKKIIDLKEEFAQNYKGNSHIQEIIPVSSSKEFPIDKSHLEYIHTFALKNPIYHNSFEQTISGIPCTVFEGDINEYWLNSIKHSSSCQPFYPTWIISAYITTLIAKDLKYNELVDIGSGDGRIAYCAKLLGLHTTGIEIDNGLVDLQNQISKSAKIDFNPICADAIEFDYSSIKLTNPVFFIGGLPQMGGDILATNIIKKISSFNFVKNTCIVFAGTQSKRQLSTVQLDGGWRDIIDKYNLKIIKTISLPTVWTFDQTVNTPYIFTKFNY
jgi:hypothetical protein